MVGAEENAVTVGPAGTQEEEEEVDTNEGETSRFFQGLRYTVVDIRQKLIMLNLCLK